MSTSSPRPALTSLVLAGMFASALTPLRAQVLPPSPPKELVFTEADNGKTAVAVVEQPIVVNLRGNPTTGFAWMLTSTNGDAVVPTGPGAYTADPGGGVGIGGTFSFPFQAVRPGETKLTFDYRQPWDPGSTVQTFVLTIHVATGDVLPRLSIELVNPNVVIRWPVANSDGFYLEGATRLQPANWAALNVLPLPEGDDYKVTLGASGGMLFFRLRK